MRGIVVNFLENLSVKWHFGVVEWHFVVVKCRFMGWALEPTPALPKEGGSGVGFDC